MFLEGGLLLELSFVFQLPYFCKLFLLPGVDKGLGDLYKLFHLLVVGPHLQYPETSRKKIIQIMPILLHQQSPIQSQHSVLPSPYNLLQPLYLPLDSQPRPTKMSNRIFLPIHTYLPQIYIFPHYRLLTLNLHVLPLISLINRIRLNFLYTETQGEISWFIVLTKTTVVQIILLHPALGSTGFNPYVYIANLKVDIVQYFNQHFFEKTTLIRSLPHLL